MRATNALLVALSAAAAVQCHNTPPRQTRNATEAPNDATPRRYIIELKSREQGARAASRAAELSGLRIVNHFDSDIFPGISVECDGACDAESLKAAFGEDEGDDSSAVAHVYKSQRIKLAPAVEEEIPSVDALAAGENNTIHQWTGVQKLHEAGILGEGATVAVVDSGIQYSHPGVGIPAILVLWFVLEANETHCSWAVALVQTTLSLEVTTLLGRVSFSQILTMLRNTLRNILKNMLAN